MTTKLPSELSKELAKLFRKVTNSQIDEDGNAHCVLTPADSIAINSARALLAAYEQEPVAWTSQRSLDVRDKITAFTSEENAIDYGKSAAWENIVALYTHPAPVPAVPDEVPEWLKDKLVTICDMVEDNDEYCQDIWNACRAAMLNGGKS